MEPAVPSINRPVRSNEMHGIHRRSQAVLALPCHCAGIVNAASSGRPTPGHHRIIRIIRLDLIAERAGRGMSKPVPPCPLDHAPLNNAKGAIHPQFSPTKGLDFSPWLLAWIETRMPQFLDIAPRRSADSALATAPPQHLTTARSECGTPRRQQQHWPRPSCWASAAASCPASSSPPLRA